jgi:hypothetical protein
MRQSGLLPHTIKKLEIENLEKILDPNTPIPCKIEIPNEKFPIFIGEEAVQYLKQYLEIRAIKETSTPASLLFTSKNKPNKEINTKDVSRTFARAAQKLKKQRKINYKTESRRPNELRLFSLIRFYKNKTQNYLNELRNNTTSRDNEFYRKLYEEKAMPFLEIEPPTPIEIHQLKKQHQKEIEKRDKEFQELSQRMKQDMTKLQPLIEFVNGDPNTLQLFLDLLKTSEKVIFPEHGTFMKMKMPLEMSKQIDLLAQKERLTWQQAFDHIIDLGLNKMEKEAEKQSPPPKRKKNETLPTKPKTDVLQKHP